MTKKESQSILYILHIDHMLSACSPKSDYYLKTKLIVLQPVLSLEKDGHEYGKHAHQSFKGYMLSNSLLLPEAMTQHTTSPSLQVPRRLVTF